MAKYDLSDILNLSDRAFDWNYQEKPKYMEDKQNYREMFGDREYMSLHYGVSEKPMEAPKTKFQDDFPQKNPSLSAEYILRGYREVHKEFIEKHQAADNFRNWRIVLKNVYVPSVPTAPTFTAIADNGQRYANSGETQMYVIYVDHNKGTPNTWMWAMFPSNMNMAHYYNKIGRELVEAEKKEIKAAESFADMAIKNVESAVKQAEQAVANLKRLKGE